MRRLGSLGKEQLSKAVRASCLHPNSTTVTSYVRGVHDAAFSLLSRRLSETGSNDLTVDKIVRVHYVHC
jgi:hypothetical protein